MTEVTWYTGKAELSDDPVVKVTLPRSQEPIVRLACKQAGLVYDPRIFVYTDDKPKDGRTIWQRVKKWFAS